jgi:acetyl esterase/lipase
MIPDRRRLILTAAALAAAAASPAARAGPLAEAMRDRRSEAARGAERGAPAPPPARSLGYGPDPMQSVLFWPAATQSGAPAPLLVFVHGGAWTMGDANNGTGRWKETHFPALGWAFASIDYRLVPKVAVEDQGRDVAHALAALLNRTEALGLDRRRVVLMGHSAGAHLAALVGTDERYLRAAGLSFADLAGVVAIDGAGYDVAAQMASAQAGVMQRLYHQAFGTDPARQRALSPTFQAEAPNAPRFLLLHVQRPDGVAQAEALAAALRRAGTPVEVDGFPGQGLQGHMEINRRLGDPAYAATGAVDRWLGQIRG